MNSYQVLDIACLYGAQLLGIQLDISPETPPSQNEIHCRDNPMLSEKLIFNRWLRDPKDIFFPKYFHLPSMLPSNNHNTYVHQLINIYRVSKMEANESNDDC